MSVQMREQVRREAEKTEVVPPEVYRCCGSRSLLVQIGSDEETAQRSLEEVCKAHRVAFVVHSEEAGKALEKFASEGARLVRVIPGSGSV